VAEIGRGVGALKVIIRRGANLISCAVINRRHPNLRGVLADEWVENARRDLVNYPAKRGIASVDFFLLEALIHKAAVIPEMADPVVVREVDVTLHGDHPAPVIFIECAYTVTQSLLQAIPQQ
jgi:hypothetical protein